MENTNAAVHIRILLNLRELQVDNISTKYTVESAKKFIPVR